MKRFAIVILAVILLMTTAAFAEKTYLGSLNVNGAFELKCTLPENYKMEIREADTTQILAFIDSGDKAKPIMTLSIAFDEMYSSVERLNDLDEAALAQLEMTFTAEDAATITYGYTDHGTKLLMAQYGNEYIDFFTIYKGYDIEFLLSAGEEPLNDAQIKMVIDFLSDLEFVEA